MTVDNRCYIIVKRKIEILRKVLLLQYGDAVSDKDKTNLSKSRTMLRS